MSAAQVAASPACGDWACCSSALLAMAAVAGCSRTTLDLLMRQQDELRLLPQVANSFSWTMLNIKGPWGGGSSSIYASQARSGGLPYPPQGVVSAGFNNPGTEAANGFFQLPASGASAHPGSCETQAVRMAAAGALAPTLCRGVLHAPQGRALTGCARRHKCFRLGQAAPAAQRAANGPWQAPGPAPAQRGAGLGGRAGGQRP